MSRDEVAPQARCGASPSARGSRRRGHSRHGTTRSSRPGTASPWRRSPRRAGSCRTEPSHARLATELAASLERRLRTRDGRLHRSWKDGRPGPAGRPGGPHPPGGRPAGAVPDDLRRAMVRLGDGAHGGRARRTSPTPRAASTTRPTTRRPVHPTAQPRRQPAAVRQRHGRDGAGAAGRADRRGALPGRRRRRPSGVLAPIAARQPTAFAQWLIGAGMLLGAPRRGRHRGRRRRTPGPRRCWRSRRSGYRPWQVVAYTNDPRAQRHPAAPRSCRGVDGRATAYVCHGFSLPAAGDRAGCPAGAAAGDGQADVIVPRRATVGLAGHDLAPGTARRLPRRGRCCSTSTARSWTP